MTLGLGIGLSDAWRLDSGGFLSGATLDMSFASGRYLGATPANLTVTRSGTNATDLTYDQTSRTSYNSFAANAARIVADGRGLLVEESRTQYLGVTDSPANQTTSSLGTGNYTLWCIGGTSVTVAAGTATITNGGAATPGTPRNFVVTGAGTVTVTVSGAVRYFQIENGAFATSYIPNAGAAGTTVTRSADQISLTGTAFSNVYPATALTLFGQTNKLQFDNTNPSTILHVNDGSTNNRISFQDQQASGFPGNAAARFSTGGVQSNPSDATTVVSGRNKHVLAVSVAAGLGFSVNGSAVTTAAPAAMPVGPNALAIGQRSNDQFFNGFIERIAIVGSRMADATLPGLST